MDQLMEECRSLKDECLTLKNDNKQLSEKLEMLEQQQARWLATGPVNHTQTNKTNQPRSIASLVTVNKAGMTAEAFSHNLSQWTLSLKLFSSYESVSQQHETLMIVYFILSKYFGSVMNHSCLTAILRHQGFFDFMNLIQSLFKMNSSANITLCFFKLLLNV